MHEEEQTPFPPAVLFRSFLLVTGAYIVNIVMLLMALAIVAMTLFPESFEILNSEPEEYNKVFAAQPEKIFPKAMLWILLLVAGMICFGLGYWVARLAPIGKFSHAIFFAVILFIQYLQLAIGSGESLQTMLILFMAVSPVAALIGANMFLRKFQAEN